MVSIVALYRIVKSALEVLVLTLPVHRWISWREQHFAIRKTAGLLSLKDFVKQKLDDDRVVDVALGLLAVAMALGQMRPGIDDVAVDLPLPANQLMNHILAAVDQVVCDSDNYRTETGIILLYMMRAKNHTENNQLRKAWLRIRQGIRCAQSIGFGVANQMNGPVPDEEAERQRFIAAIFEVDHIISMVLGFPYAKDSAFTDARAFSILLNSSIRDEDLKMRALRRVVAVTAGHINDRNASGDIDETVIENTQATLDMAANCMPPGWWNMLSQPLSGMARHRYESIMVQTWFWVVQSYLHMPYVIKANQTPTTRRYRHLGLEGARNLMRSFNYLRTEPAVSMYMCNCDDFQALLGACILLVGVLQNLSEDADSPMEDRGVDPYIREGDASIEADLALIEDLKDIFRYRMSSQGGGISKQGLAVLEELTSLLYEDEDAKESRTSFKGDMLAFGIDLSKRQKTIMLPYFGTIKIELTRKLPKRRPQDFSQHMVLTPPKSIDGSCSENSPNACLSLDDMQFQQNEPSASFQGQFQPNITSAPETTSSYAGNNQTNCLDMGSIDCALQSMNMPPIEWEQWENYMFDQELNQDWNPGFQWTHDPSAYNYGGMLDTDFFTTPANCPQSLQR